VVCAASRQGRAAKSNSFKVDMKILGPEGRQR
jgi:hypothetical protein